MRAAGLPEGESILGSLKNGQKVIVEDGVAKLMDRTAFAGSVATADRLVQTMITLADVPLIDAVKMMTATPALRRVRMQILLCLMIMFILR
jgi:N-acetylglucosamine-6-phosphate deacetylase